MGVFKPGRDTEVDPQDLLPENLRSRWAVVPNFELYQLFIAGFLIGAGTLASILGISLGPKYLWYGFPVALVLCFLQTKILGKRADGLLRELSEGRADGGAES